MGQIEKKSFPYNVSSTESEKIWHNYQYDLYGRISAETAPYTNLSYSYSARQETVHDNIRNTDHVKLKDAAGKLVQSTDPGGTINYGYRYVSDNNQVRTENTINAVGATTTVISDLRGNRLSITEPDAGEVSSVYDNFGRLVSQTDARGMTTAYTYDLLNRTVRKQFASDGDTLTHTFTYDSLDAANVWKGAMMEARINPANAVTYHYDSLGRPVEKITRIEGEDFSFGYTYDSLSRNSITTYPNNFAIKYNYDNESRVNAILDNTTQSKLYKVRDRDQLQRAKIIVYGNETGSQYYRNDYGNIIRIRQGYTYLPENEDLLDRDSLIFEEQPFINTEYSELCYTYNDAGLMSSRKDSVTRFREIFEYDNLDRLTAFTIANADSSVFEYHTTSFADNGNIMANSHIGAYSYDSDKPHAVTGITLDSAHAHAISAAQCDVHYNLFNQPDTITEGQWQLILYYGPDLTRWKTVLKKNGNVVETHWYVGDSYEKATNNVGSSVHNNIVSGEENAKVICQQGYGTNTYYYVHPDILGSWSVISRQGKRLYRSIHFDPWGNPRKFSNWTLVDSTTLTGFSMPARGFTGHEHLQRFNIINMKGRLYDPVIGRFFSPDNFVQLPDFTQNYNRYSYCLNNPLAYVDPSGEGFADALLLISNILTFPARVITEGVEYINDVINNDIQESGYFHFDYLAGTASPYPVDTRNIIYNQVDHYDFYDISKSHGSIISADNSLFTYEFYWAGFEMNGYKFQKGSGKTWYQRSKYKKWGQTYIRAVNLDKSNNNFDEIENNAYTPIENINSLFLNSFSTLFSIAEYGNNHKFKYSKKTFGFLNYLTIGLSAVNVGVEIYHDGLNYSTVYGIVNTSISACGIGGAAAALTMDLYKDAAIFFIETTNQINSQCSSNDFWLYLYGF